jgi:hypothetical protein
MATSAIHSPSHFRSITRGSHIAKNDATLWDRIVFVAFCGCLLLFLHALAGFGALEEDAISTKLLQPGLPYSRQANPDGKRSCGVLQADGNDYMTRVMESCEEDGLAMNRALPCTDGCFSVRAATPEEAVLAPTPAATDTQSSYSHLQPASLLQPLYDPFDLEPFFDADEYDNNGQPFALKIHVEEMVTMQSSGNVRRCQASGGLRCP